MSAGPAAAPSGVVTFLCTDDVEGSTRRWEADADLDRDRHRGRTPPRVLGDETYKSLSRKGEAITVAEIATYAYDQIDQARAELKAIPN